jgi:rod shape-determining protein MreC
MNRIYLIFFSFLLLLLFQIPFLKSNLIDGANFLKEEVLHFKSYLITQINFFKNQQNTIERLREENRKLNYELSTFEAFFETCRDLKYFEELDKPNLYFVKTISYAALPDFTQIYVDYPKKMVKPRGLVYNNMAAGIVVKNFGKYSLALLNSNPKTTYTVIIGKKEIPGIFYGKENVVKYIKKYVPIKVGDIVKTSGLDGIFYKGALVGKVEKVIQKKLYQEVKIKLYYQKMTPDFFYVVEKNDTIKKTLRRGNGLKSN